MLTTENRSEVKMPAKPRLKLKSYFVDERTLSRAKKAPGVDTDFFPCPILRGARQTPV